MDKKLQEIIFYEFCEQLWILAKTLKDPEAFRKGPQTHCNDGTRMHKTLGQEYMRQGQDIKHLSPR